MGGLADYSTQAKVVLVPQRTCSVTLPIAAAWKLHQQVKSSQLTTPSFHHNQNHNRRSSHHGTKLSSCNSLSPAYLSSTGPLPS